MYRPDYHPDVFFHWHQMPVRFRDIDPLNHVNNAVYNTYFEEARIQFVSTVPVLAEGFTQKKSFVLVKSTIEYLKPILYPQTLLIGTSCLELGNTSIEAIQAIYGLETKQLHSVAITKGVWFDLSRNRPAPLPQIDHIETMMFNPAVNG